MGKADRKRLASHKEMLPVKLTDSEHLDRAKKWAKACEELALQLAEADEVKKELKAKEAHLEEVQRRLQHVVGAGAEPREVLVEAWADFATNKFEEVRTDTGQVINRRALEAHERQGAFDPGEWGEQLHLRLLREREDVAKKRAGEKGEAE
jgi:hypothetical protein